MDSKFRFRKRETESFQRMARTIPALGVTSRRPEPKVRRLSAGGSRIRTFRSARDRLIFKALSLVGRLVVRRITKADGLTAGANEIRALGPSDRRQLLGNLRSLRGAAAWRRLRLRYSKSNRITGFRQGSNFLHGLAPNRSFVEPDQTRSFYLTAFRAHDRMGYRGDTQHQNGMDRDIGKPFKTVAVVEGAGRIAVGPHRETGADRPPDVVI